MKQKKNRKNRQSISATELSRYIPLICPAIEKAVNGSGFNLFELSFVNENQENYLRLTIMHEDRLVSVDDCAVVSRNVGKELDSSDSIPFPYMLEVQSKGISEDIFQKPIHEFVLEKIGLTVRS